MRIITTDLKHSYSLADDIHVANVTTTQLIGLNDQFTFDCWKVVTRRLEDETCQSEVTFIFRDCLWCSAPIPSVTFIRDGKTYRGNPLPTCTACNDGAFARRPHRPVLRMQEGCFSYVLEGEDETWVMFDNGVDRESGERYDQPKWIVTTWFNGVAVAQEVIK